MRKRKGGSSGRVIPLTLAAALLSASTIQAASAGNFVTEGTDGTWTVQTAENAKSAFLAGGNVYYDPDGKSDTAASTSTTLYDLSALPTDTTNWGNIANANHYPY